MLHNGKILPVLCPKTDVTVLDICTGAGGEALGLEVAGFTNVGSVEIEAIACQTLRINRPSWPVIESDIRAVNGLDFRGIGLLAGGVPCPPFTIAGKQLGADDERDLFPEALRLIEQAKPTAVMLENVPGFASIKFESYRNNLIYQLSRLHYEVTWRVLNSSDYGVPQLRPRFVLVALRNPYANAFYWPSPIKRMVTVSNAIGDLMASGGWNGATQWCHKANSIAPTLVGGSKKHGGPDLGPTRARRQWAALGIDGLGLADQAPGADFPIDGLPRLTLRMAARLQAFPDTWNFAGGKTAIYRQIGNAFPSLVAQVVGEAILSALSGRNPTYQQIKTPLLQASLFQDQDDELLQTVGE
jgi:DNA (cytosine-5)-methyltransferase 1